MYCRSCGSKLEDGKAFCGNCGAAVQPGAETPSVSATATPAKQPKDKKKENRLCIISMLLLFIPSLVVIPLAITRVADDILTLPAALVISGIYSIMLLTAYVLMIIARVKYGTTLSKVMMVIYWVIFVLVLVIGGILLLTAIADCGNDFVECVHHF